MGLKSVIQTHYTISGTRFHLSQKLNSLTFQCSFRRQLTLQFLARKKTVCVVYGLFTEYSPGLAAI